MHSSLVIYVISALSYMIHVEGISIVDTPLPHGEEQLSNRNLATFSQKDGLELERVESIAPNAKPYQDTKKTLHTAGRNEESKAQELNVMEFDFRNMEDVHTRLFSKSEPHAWNALKTIRLQIFHQVRSDRNWRKGNSMEIMNLKALELLLLNLDAIERANYTLNLFERRLLENTMETIYDLRNFSDYPDSERVWLYRKVDDFFKNTNSLFLKQEYLQTVRRRVANMDYNISLIDVTGPKFRIDRTHVIRRNMPSDVLYFINVFNDSQRTIERGISDLQKTLDHWSQALEAPSSIKQPPQVNRLRLELIGVGAVSLGLKTQTTSGKNGTFLSSPHL